MVLFTGNIVTGEQMGKGRELLGPGEFFQHTAQVNHIVRARDRGQRRIVRPQEGQPTEDMRIAAQLIERVNISSIMRSTIISVWRTPEEYRSQKLT